MFFTNLISKLFKPKSKTPFRYFQLIGDNLPHESKAMHRIIAVPANGLVKGESYWGDGATGFQWSLDEIQSIPVHAIVELTREEALKIIPNLP